MIAQELKVTYVAFLRGINVGGHHKVPMGELKNEFENLGFEKVTTILNSGNIIFDAKGDKFENIEKRIFVHLENYFGFSIPIIVRKAEALLELFYKHPFREIAISKNTRLYISFLKSDENLALELPWTSPDNSYRILEYKAKSILSVLDLSISKTPKAMEILEKSFGKELTTRNWNTIEKIERKLQAGR